MKISIISMLVCTLVSTMCFSQTKKEFSNYPKGIKINQIQLLGTHNSYAKPVDPKVLDMVSSIISKYKGAFLSKMSPEEKAKFKEYHPNGLDFKEALNYEHPDFETQLNAGIRSLEIDVYYDPQGGRFLNPAAYSILKNKGVVDLYPYSKEGLDKPGFKVLHIADIDFRTHYTTFKKALLALKQWSDKNPEHMPIIIMVEAKDSALSLFPNATKVLKFDKNAFDQLDQVVLKVLGREKIITPDDVRGNYATLNEAVLNKNWPTVESAKGKFLFTLLPGSAGLSAEQSPYIEGHPSLKGRVMFVQSQPGKDYAAFILKDNAIVRQDEIIKLVSKGYLVRTRSDIETYEAKVNDHTRKEAAFSSGAQVVSTDFFRKGNTYNTDYFVELPGGETARCNPVNSGDVCNLQE